MTTPLAGSASLPLDSPHVLDRAAWASLTGVHQRFARSAGRARRYPAQVSPFAAIDDARDPFSWRDLATLYPTDEIIALSGPPGIHRLVPDDWRVGAVIAGVQLVATPRHETRPDDEAFLIDADNAQEAAELVARTEPGPFRPQTYQMGRYIGIRRGGELVALAGERLHPPGWTEISAVCTDPHYRRQGLATRLVRAVGHHIRARGDQPFLHTGAANGTAIALYLSLGYELRREVEFLAVQAPAIGDHAASSHS